MKIKLSPDGSRALEALPEALYNEAVDQLRSMAEKSYDELTKSGILRKVQYDSSGLMETLTGNVRLTGHLAANSPDGVEWVVVDAGANNPSEDKGPQNYGFIVVDNSGSPDPEYTEEYLELRRRLFGIAKTYPEWVIPLGVDPATGTRRLHLKNAHLGLLETYEQAESMLAELRGRFPHKPLEIMIYENPKAESIRFYRDRPS